MSARTYPYTAWVLLPSFKPKQIEITKAYGAWDGSDYGDLSEAGKLYPRAEIFESKAAAIAGGRARLAKQGADLDKKLNAHAAKVLALDKAEKEKP